eukprot:TRINITY_DN13726_c0_g1_i1.p1 TRINITY_DN13726_c0_g1~~TRINITY_DN13726_c0_g1_i1.p1  ORF type:complete len:339 (-),score=89.58 TRINITY_DN13726_c0_g1_i1:35-1051(-)
MLEKIEESVDLSNDAQKDVTQVVKNLVDKWKGNDKNIKVKELAGGITNKLFSCSDEEKFTVLVRVYGHGTENIIDREAELKGIERLSRNGFAPKLHGRFENGFVYGYYDGKTLKAQDLVEGKFNERIARMMARWHKQEVKGFAKEPCLWEKLKSWIDLLPEKYSTEEKTKILKENFRPEKLNKELNFLKGNLTALNSPVVYCHNDLLSGNIIVDEEKDEIHFIDYEYGAYNYRAFDIANHFCEWGGFEMKNFPSKEKQFQFIREYLKITNGRQATDDEVQELFSEITRFVMASHFWWATWALVQESLSEIEFDYLGYALKRMSLYNRTKEQLTVPQAE